MEEELTYTVNVVGNDELLGIISELNQAYIRLVGFIPDQRNIGVINQCGEIDALFEQLLVISRKK